MKSLLLLFFIFITFIDGSKYIGMFKHHSGLQHNGVSALALQPTSVSAVASHAFSFDIDIHNNNAQTITALVNQNIHGSQLADLTQQFISYIADEISLTIGMDNTHIRHIHWKLNITPSFGSLRMFGLVAHINGNNVQIVGKKLDLWQPIPDVYDQQQVCARTGSRKFGVVGQRKMKCYTHDVKRGLNGHEIQLVTNKLIEKANEVQYQIEN